MPSDPQNPSTRRKRGAPIGNQNAVTHGLYSRKLRPHLNAPLPPGAAQSSSEEAEALARLIQAYAQAALQADTFDQVMGIAYAFYRTLIRLAPLRRIHQRQRNP